MTDAAAGSVGSAPIWGRHRKRIWLFVGVLLLDAMMVAMATSTVLANRERAVEQVRTTAANLADLVQRNLTDYGVRIDGKLQGVVDELERAGGVDSGHPARRETWWRKFEERLPSGSLLQIVDPSGRPLLTRPGWPAATHDRGLQEMFRGHRADQGDALRVAPPIQDTGSGRWFIPCSRVWRAADGSVAGLVVAAIPIAHFEQLIAGINAGPHGLLLLRDIDRGLIAFSRPLKGAAGQIGSRKITPEAKALLDSGAEKASYDAPMSPDGVPRTYAFHWSRPMSIVVGVGMAPQDYLTAWRREAQSSALLVLVLLVMSTVGAWVIHRAWERMEADIDARQSREERLRDSEQRFAALIAASPDWIFEVDAAFNYTFSSPRVRAVIGRTAEQVVGCGVLDLLADREVARIGPVLERLAANQAVIDLPEVIHRCADGSERVIEMRASPIVDDLGRVTGYRGISRDVTEHRRLHRKLARSEARMRQLIHESPLALEVVSDRGETVRINRAWASMWGQTSPRSGSPDEGGTADPARGALTAAIRRVLAGGPAEVLITRHPCLVRPDAGGGTGTLVVKTRIYGNRDEHGKVQECVLLQEDVTQLTQAEAELSRYREQLEDLVVQRTAQLTRTQFALDHVGLAISWHDTRTGRFIYANDECCRLSGYERGELLTLDACAVHPMFPPEEVPGLASAMRQGQSILNVEVEIRRKDGSTFPAESTLYFSATAQHDECFIVFSRDISERKAAEQRILEAKAAAETASAAKSAFLANMSHEIRTPLNAITGMAYLIRRAGLNPQQVQQMNKLEAAGEHLLGTINAVLELSKIEAGKVVLEETTLSIDGLVRNVMSMMQERVRARRLRVTCSIGRLPPNLLGDATRLQQSLLNYMSNAVKFTEQGSIDLGVTCAEEDDQGALLRFEVRDSGVGIEAGALSRLFDAFEQADSSTTRRYGGTGLGLAITRRFAELMGGEAGAQSTPGVGSVFWFSARLKKGGELADAMPVQSARLAAQAIRGEHPGARVLLVEDEPINREIAITMLEDAGMSVIAAENGREALSLAECEDYALILMDMHMPEIDGLEATRRIRLLERHADTPIVAMTANAFVEDKMRCLDAGMNDFLTKPVETDTLYATLRRWMGSRASQAHALEDASGG